MAHARRVCWTSTAAATAVALGVVVATAAAQPAARAVACRSEANALQVRAAHLTCVETADAIATFEGAPKGCLTSTVCVQSGIDGARRAVMIVGCRRRHLKVACAVYVKNAHGHARDPKLDGIRLTGRWSDATVTFVMRHDP